MSHHYKRILFSVSRELARRIEKPALIYSVFIHFTMIDYKTNESECHLVGPCHLLDATADNTFACALHRSVSASNRIRMSPQT